MMKRIDLPLMKIQMRRFQYLISGWMLLGFGLMPNSSIAKNDTLRVKKDSVIILKPADIIRGERRVALPVIKPQLQTKLRKQAAFYKVGSTRSFAGLNGLPALPNSQDDLEASYIQSIKKPVPDTVRKLINTIEAKFKEVTQNKWYIKLITGDQLLDFKFPRAISKTIAGKEYVLMLLGLKFRN